MQTHGRGVSRAKSRAPRSPSPDPRGKCGNAVGQRSGAKKRDTRWRRGCAVGACRISKGLSCAGPPQQTPVHNNTTRAGPASARSHTPSRTTHTTHAHPLNARAHTHTHTRRTHVAKRPLRPRRAHIPNTPHAHPPQPTSVHPPGFSCGDLRQSNAYENLPKNMSLA